MRGGDSGRGPRGGEQTRRRREEIAVAKYIPLSAHARGFSFAGVHGPRTARGRDRIGKEVGERRAGDDEMWLGWEGRVWSSGNFGAMTGFALCHISLSGGSGLGSLVVLVLEVHAVVWSGRLGAAGPHFTSTLRMTLFPIPFSGRQGSTAATWILRLPKTAPSPDPPGPLMPPSKGRPCVSVASLLATPLAATRMFPSNRTGRAAGASVRQGRKEIRGGKGAWWGCHSELPIGGPTVCKLVFIRFGGIGFCSF